MDIGLTTVLLFGSIFLLFVIGCPISFSLIIVSLVFGAFLWGPSHLYMLASSLYGATTSQILMAIPLFILMGNVLATTGLARDMFQALYYWSGPVRGGLAMGTVAICAVFAAMCGTSTAATITMGTIALPAMRDHAYNKELSIGSVAAGGLLGILIPPSVIAIIYASSAGLSVGQLYFGIFIPGFLLAFLYIAYIGLRAWWQPGWAPSIPKAERPSWSKKFRSLKGVVLPLVIVAAVLGGIYSGIITPTEAAGVGALCVILAAALTRSLTWTNLTQALRRTLELTSMVVWLIMGVTVFTNVYNALGAPEIIQRLVELLPVSGFGVIILMQLSIFILGMIMDDIAIILLCTPIFLPIVQSLGYDTLWFGVLFMVNIQLAWLSPPYGFNLFYMRAITPADVSMMDIYRSVLPFLALQMLCLILVMLIPALATWLPGRLV
ncbi:MAG: TRAP transporter large permease subunit [Thermodesulfobacteriota bacterium]